MAPFTPGFMFNMHIDIPVHYQLILTVNCYINHYEHLENPFGQYNQSMFVMFERAGGRKWSPKQCILNSLAVMMACTRLVY